MDDVLALIFGVAGLVFVVAFLFPLYYCNKNYIGLVKKCAVTFYPKSQ